MFQYGEHKMYRYNFESHAICTQYIYVYIYTYSILREIDPDTAYVVFISVSLGLPYMVSVLYSLVFLTCYPYALISLYGKTAHCAGYGVAMDCHGLFIVPRTAIVTSQWYDRYRFTEYARTRARHQTTPWQRECKAIKGCKSIDSLLDSMRFVTHFWEIAPYIYWWAQL